MKSSDIIDKQISILPNEIRYCKDCVVSNQRPRIILNESQICGACLNKHNKKK